MRLLAAILPLFLALPSVGLAARDRDYDVVVLRNGDTHLGTLAFERLALDTAYGRLSIPRNLVARLERTATGGGETIVRTWEGERYSGRLAHERLTLMRIDEPALYPAPGELLQADLARHKVRAALAPVSDVVAMQNGDRFRGRLLSSDLLVQGESGLALVSREDVFLVDLEPDEADRPRVRMQRDGNLPALHGTLLTAELRLRNRLGDELLLAATDVSNLAVDVVPRPSAPDDSLDDGFRARLPSASLLRDRLRDGSAGPLVVALRGGPFRRGDLSGGGDADEQSQSIRVQPFALGVYEVTFEEYDRFCIAAGRECPDDEGWGRGRRPVVNVSWDDATAYAQWLSGQTGEGYRLPTDAEWELAARAGTESRFWWGEELERDRANCSGCGSLWDGERTAPVGSFSPNGFGLHDTAGNVFEWVADCWHDRFDGAPADGGPLEKPDCGKRVIRGGAWSFPPAEIRSANRWRDFYSRRSDDTGFRLARELAR